MRKKLSIKGMEHKVFWFSMIALYGFFFATMIYADFAVTFEHGVILCECIFEGKFFEFYDLACGGIYNNPAVYDIGIYLIWAIWCIPVYIVTRFWHVHAAETPVLMLYGKLLVVVFHFLTAWVIDGIAKNLHFDDIRRKLLQIIYVSSICMIVPTIGNGQFDIIPAFFILWGVYFYTKKEYKKFLIVMSFAVAFKIFAIFIFIPLVLLKEKRILWILRDGVCVSIATIFFKLLFWGKTTDYYDTLYFYSPDQYTDGWLLRMFKIQFPGGIGDISLFILGFVLICGLAYFIKTEQDQINRTAILYGFLVYLNFFLFISAHPQWIVLLIPFLYLLAFCDETKWRLSLVWATLIDALFFICLSYKWNKVFWSGNELRGLDAFFTRPESGSLGGSFGNLIDQLGFSYIYPGMVAALVAVCIVFVLYQLTNKITFIEVRKEEFEKKIISSRLAIIVIYVVSLLVISYVP